MNGNRNQKLLILIVLVVISSQILIWAVRAEDNKIENLHSFFLPLYRGSEWIKDIFGDGEIFPGPKISERRKSEAQRRVRELRADNILLQERIEELKIKIEAGAMEEKLPFEVIPAQVIGRDPYDWWGKAIIDQGKEEGVGEGLVVVTYQVWWAK